MVTNELVGSTWKKWDLHVHTPSSFVNNYPGSEEEAWEAFLKDLEGLPAEFKVIGINDYFHVDGYERVRRAKDEGRLGNIDLILQVIELRLDKFGGVVTKEKGGNYDKSDWSRINLHVIFDALDPEVIRHQFISALSHSYHLIPESTAAKGLWNGVINRPSIQDLGQKIIDAAPADKKSDYASPATVGFDNLCVSLDGVETALKAYPLAGKYLLAVGKTEWADLKWSDQAIAEKRNVINKADLVFTAAENPTKYATARRSLIEGGVTDKLLDCSDAHWLSSSSDKDRIGNCFTWIKADATFAGLLNRPGYELTPKSWTVAVPPTKRYFSAGTPPG